MKDKYGEGRERCRGASGSASDQGKEEERSFIRANWHVVSSKPQHKSPAPPQITQIIILFLIH